MAIHELATAGLDRDAFSTLYRFKWPNGFVCPRCKHNRCYTIRSRKLPLFQCHSCKHQTSLTAGTIMEGSRTPLSKWMIAIKLISRSSHKGTTAVQLMYTLQVTYKTAWSMLHKIRQAITKADNEAPLNGDVRAKMQFYVRPYPSIHNRFPYRSPVVVLAEVDEGERPTRLKFKHVPDILMGASLTTFGEKYMFHHYTRRHPDAPIPPVAKFLQIGKHPQVRDTFQPARRWINLTFRGIGPKYLQAYLDEYCFQYNCTFQERQPETTLLPLCMTTRRIPMKRYNPRIILPLQGVCPTYDLYLKMVG